jgi:hypothetical protein
MDSKLKIRTFICNMLFESRNDVGNWALDGEGEKSNHKLQGILN